MVENVANEVALHELFLSFHTLLAGKIRTFGTDIGYLRELNLGARYQPPWSELILSPRFDYDFRRLSQSFPPLVDRADGTDACAETARQLKLEFCDFVYRVCVGTVYHRSTPGPISSVTDELAGLGATLDDVRAVTAELELVRDSLTDPAFRDFALAAAPEYITTG